MVSPQPGRAASAALFALPEKSALAHLLALARSSEEPACFSVVLARAVQMLWG